MEAAAPEVPEVESTPEVADLSPGDPNFLGQLEGRTSWWDAIAKGAFVSEAVRGHRLEFSSRPPVSLPARPPSQRLKREKRAIFQEEIDSLLVKRAIEPVRDEHRGFYSNLVLVKKQDP